MPNTYPLEIIWKKEVLDSNFEETRNKVEQEFTNLKIATAKMWDLPSVEDGPQVLIDLSNSFAEIGVVSTNFSQSCLNLAKLYLEYYKLNFEQKS
jgi:hypothetical protein